MPAKTPAYYNPVVYQHLQQLPYDLHPLQMLLPPLSDTVKTFRGVTSDIAAISAQLRHIAGEVTSIESLLSLADEVPVIGEITAALQGVLPEITATIDGLTETMTATIDPIVIPLKAVLDALTKALDILADFVDDAADFAGDFAQAYGLIGLVETVLMDIGHLFGVGNLPAGVADFESTIGTALRLTNTDLMPLASAIGQFSRALPPLSATLRNDLNKVQPALLAVKQDLDTLLGKLKELTEPLRAAENAIPGGAELSQWIEDGAEWVTEKMGALIPSALKRHVLAPLEHDVLRWLDLTPLEVALKSINLSGLQAHQQNITPEQASTAHRRWQVIEHAFHQADLDPVTRAPQELWHLLLAQLTSAPHGAALSAAQARRRHP